MSRLNPNVAQTFTATAETTDNGGDAERNIRNAPKAYDSIQSFRRRYVLTDTQTGTLDLKLADVKVWLEALWETFLLLQ